MMCVLIVTGLTHVTKLDDSLLPRAEALKDCTATDSNKLSFKVAKNTHREPCGYGHSMIVAD